MPGDTTTGPKKPDQSTSKHRKGRKGSSQTPRVSEKAKATVSKPDPPARPTAVPNETPLEDGDEENEDVCHICAEPMEKKAYAVAECNHRTCHTCAIRLRALYKRLDCTFCKKPQPLIIVTSSGDRLFESYAPSDTPYHDNKLSMHFESSDMMEDCLLLLRFNCPDVNCDHVTVGWPELKHHTKTIHSLFLCDLCIRHKKIFAHEHTLYTSQQLGIHLPTSRGAFFKKSHVSNSTLEIDSHPVCEFCHEAFYGEDEQFSHMRQTHEECFVCKAAGIRHQYFQNYNTLERHFHEAHYPCPHSDCLAQKFVVFSTAIDLQGHVVEKHGETMSTRDLKDARRIQTEFAPSEQTTGRGRPHRTERRNGTSHGIAPQTETSTPSFDSSVQARRRMAFSSTLSAEQVAASALSVPAETPAPPSMPEATPAQIQQHNAFMARIAAATQGSPNAVPALKAAIRSYRSSESNARALVDTFFTVLDQDLGSTGTFISSLVDLLDDEEKKTVLLSTWKAYKLEHQQQFPSLTPATSNNYAGITSGRAVQVKRLQPGGGGRRRVWDRVEQAAASTLGPLPVESTTKYRAPVIGHTPWSTSAAAGSASAQNRPAGSNSTKPPAPSSSAFPSLPSSTAMRPPKEFLSGQSSLRAIVGAVPSTNAWTRDEQPLSAVEDDHQENTPPARRKKAAKQTLFTLGSYR